MVDEALATRVARVLAQAARAEEAARMSHLADIAGDDESAQMWAERGAAILNAMPKEDLGLVIVAGYNDRAQQEAWRLWEKLFTTRAEDVTP